jgi:hypothetical protein
MKKILILISGKLKYLSDQNFFRIKENFKNFDTNFFLTPWSNEDESLIMKFKNNYKPLMVKKIVSKKYDNEIKRVKFPDYAANIQGFFYNWDGFCKGINEIISYSYKKKYFPDYILRYRSDILPKKNSFFKIPEIVHDKQLIVPDRYHWHGINDQIFLLNFNTAKIFNFFFNFVKNHIDEERFFSGEYIFYRFLKKNKFQLTFNNFNYNLMREKNFKKEILSNDFKSIIPFRDNLTIKFNKFNYKIRNFSEFFIFKNKRNKYQDIVVD